ncbi:ribose 5-phosphate isomerase B [Caproiciproducens galactitolivorans]|uniref:Ribose-5-phosphate isomerase B n=1 Tax=Caproiciproducens galactitolivorans TaxID=642589 RepID=A0A4Z0Y9Z4_9FIRM|nr:ribose 5-phosphate isomerase B [Caproiciproducens galactitolivorans]QEY34732.1 ribose 5-phosphate isomerase B [Caproiciproducens galactitolivorans]TGJ75790.1 ribose-5-phosphate isomerase B [Caproiciproducens galactitolivorans]
MDRNTIVIGCDNAAVDMKNLVAEYLKSKGYTIENMGCDDSSDPTNYPTIAKRLCRKIIESGYNKRGILICGTGIGMAMCANKFKGIRAAVCHDAYSAERSALSNNANVICMGARVIGPELAKKIVDEWLPLEYKGGRSTPKLEEIAGIEKENFQ